MRKPTNCIRENKDADQLRVVREDDQRLCFRYMDSALTLLLKSKISFYYCYCVGPVRKPHCRFSHEAAHLVMLSLLYRASGRHKNVLNLYPKIGACLSMPDGLFRILSTFSLKVQLQLRKIQDHVSCRMGKPTICIGEKKGADQLCSY